MRKMTLNSVLFFQVALALFSEENAVIDGELNA